MTSESYYTDPKLESLFKSMIFDENKTIRWSDLKSLLQSYTNELSFQILGNILDFRKVHTIQRAVYTRHIVWKACVQRDPYQLTDACNDYYKTKANQMGKILQTGLELKMEELHISVNPLIRLRLFFEAFILYSIFVLCHYGIFQYLDQYYSHINGDTQSSLKLLGVNVAKDTWFGKVKQHVKETLKTLITEDCSSYIIPSDMNELSITLHTLFEWTRTSDDDNKEISTILQSLNEKYFNSKLLFSKDLQYFQRAIEYVDHLRHDADEEEKKKTNENNIQGGGEGKTAEGMADIHQ